MGFEQEFNQPMFEMGKDGLEYFGVQAIAPLVELDHSQTIGLTDQEWWVLFNPRMKGSYQQIEYSHPETDKYLNARNKSLWDLPAEVLRTQQEWVVWLRQSDRPEYALPILQALSSQSMIAQCLNLPRLSREVQQAIDHVTDAYNRRVTELNDAARESYDQTLNYLASGRAADRTYKEHLTSDEQTLYLSEQLIPPGFAANFAGEETQGDIVYRYEGSGMSIAHGDDSETMSSSSFTAGRASKGQSVSVWRGGGEIRIGPTTSKREWRIGRK
jgi:hypothetical protein